MSAQVIRLADYSQARQRPRPVLRSGPRPTGRYTCRACGGSGHNRRSCTDYDALAALHAKENEATEAYIRELQRTGLGGRAETVTEIELTPEQVASMADQIVEALSPRGAS